MHKIKNNILSASSKQAPPQNLRISLELDRIILHNHNDIKKKDQKLIN